MGTGVTDEARAEPLFSDLHGTDINSTIEQIQAHRLTWVTKRGNRLV